MATPATPAVSVTEPDDDDAIRTVTERDDDDAIRTVTEPDDDDAIRTVTERDDDDAISRVAAPDDADVKADRAEKGRGYHHEREYREHRGGKKSGPTLRRGTTRTFELRLSKFLRDERCFRDSD